MAPGALDLADVQAFRPESLILPNAHRVIAVEHVRQRTYGPGFYIVEQLICMDCCTRFGSTDAAGRTTCPGSAWENP